MHKTVIPLHPAQHDVYTEQLLNTRSPLYNVGGYIRLKGPLNRAKFFDTVTKAPRYFDSFRLRYNFEAADFKGYIDGDFLELPLDYVDFTPRPDAATAALNWLKDDFNTAFSFADNMPLCRQALLKISVDEHWFYGRYHHLITDGYGFIVWVKYLANAYRLTVEEFKDQLAFTNYEPQILTAAHHYKLGVYEEDTRYWAQKFTSRPEPLLQKKRSGNGNAAGKNALLTIEINAPQQKLINELKQTTHAGLLPLTLAALCVYFGKGLGREEMVFGVPVHKRPTRQARNIMGMFSGILPFACAYNPAATVKQLLETMVKLLKEDFKHQQFILGDVVRNLKMNYPAERLFDVMVNYEPFNFALDFGQDIQAGIYQLTTNVARVPLQFTWQDHGVQQPLQLQVDFDVDYFDKRDIGFLVQSLFTVFEQMIDGNKPVNEIDILSAEERHLLDTFNGPALDFTFTPLHTFFEQQAVLTSQATAVVIDATRYTYQQLNSQSNQLAHFLIHQNLPPQTPIPVCLERSFEMLVAIFGILKAGLAYVPVDPDYPADRIAYMLHDTRATLVLTSKKAKAYLPATAQLQLIQADDAEAFVAFAESNPDLTVLPGHLSYVIYTSGSTGQPKGVMITHGNVAAFINWCRHEFAQSHFDIVYAATSICFDLSVFEIFYPLSIGKTLRLLNNGLHIAQSLALDKNILLNTVPLVIDNLLKEQANLSNVTLINMAGEPVPPALVQQLNTRAIEVRNLYGPTEDTTYSTVYRLHNNQPVLIGKPISGTHIYLTNPQNQLVPLGSQGEICISGAGLATGYWNNEKLTAEKFISNPFDTAAGARLYQTGDLGRWHSNGNLEYLGRLDSQVKIRGFRIELGEIENTLLQSGLVQNAVVIVKNDASENKTLIGYVVADLEIDTEICNSYLKQKLPHYMLPAMWMQIEKLPLTPNGKVDRKQLPEPVQKTNGKHFEPAANLLEEALLSIWQDVLGVNPISVHDNFFELGGHSIKAIQVISRLHKQLNFKIEFSQFNTNPTIRQLALLLSALQTTSFKPINKIPAQQFYELSNAQKRTWVLCRLKGGSLSFNSPVAFVFEGDVAVDLLKQTLNLLIDRHEGLRTVFIEHEGKPLQQIKTLDQVNFALQTLDVSNNPEADALIDALFKNETTQEFDLVNGPLMRATFITQATGKHIFLFNIHHIVSDGWSREILINDFIAILASLLNNMAIPPVLSPATYKDYAVWQTSLFASQQQYWDETLGKNLPATTFPADFERPKIISFSGELLQVNIPVNITQKLTAFALANNVTLNNMLFAVYGLLVAHYSQQSQIIIGSLASGRNHADVENMVGLFINFLPVRLAIDRDLTLSAYLKQSSQALHKAYSNQDYPFDLMVERYVTDRDFSRNPLFDTMLNFHSENKARDEYTIPNQNSGTALTIKPLNNFRENVFQSNLDFKLDIEEADNVLALSLSYNAKLFANQRMQNFLHQYKQLLKDMISEEDKPLKEYLPWVVSPGIAPTQPVDKPLTGLQVCICSSFVSEPVLEYLQFWDGEHNLGLDVKFTDYNQVFQQLLNPASAFNTNKGINVLFLRLQDWLRENKNLPEAEAKVFLNDTYAELVKALSYSQTVNPVPIIGAIIPFNNTGSISQQTEEHINHLNQNLERLLKTQPQFIAFNVNNVADLYEVTDVFDKQSDDLGHIPFSPEFFAALGTFLARKIRSYKSKVYKVLAIDCDNTLWKGICGEVGYENVEVNENYRYLQNFLLQKYNEGFLLVLCSKNNEADVWEVFEKNKTMVLKREHIAAHRINWLNKPLNALSIAVELNVGLDSFIFIDDSAFEVEQMTLECPDVLSFCLPADENEFKSFLDHTWEFDVFKVTEADTKRNVMYKTEKDRSREQLKHGSLNDFMQSLQIKVTVRPMEPEDVERAVQLSLRTNQFNMNGVRLTREQIAERANQTQNLVRIIEVSDRFGDYGTVGLLIATIEASTLILQNFLLSCRVLGRGVEGVIMNELKNFCVGNGLKDIQALYQPTIKNKPFHDFLHEGEWQLNADTNTYHSIIKYSAEEITT